MKEVVATWLLPLLSVSLTLLAVLGLLRWLAPQLLGLPVDLRMVQVQKAVPPFFDNVFRKGDYESTDFLIPDPVLKRARPLYPDLLESGPHDILGFRNRSIPNVADVITIGDSQTYGNNVPLEENWPHRMGATVKKKIVLYDMSVGGWGAVEYLEIFRKAIHFLPRVVVVAFYSGNDALESFFVAYSDERWSSLRPDPSITARDAPQIPFPAPRSEWWTVTFQNGQTVTFTPQLRLAANQDHPAVEAGYGVMREAAKLMADMAAEVGIKMVFTVIPTKELVYAPRIAQEGIKAPDAYRRLVEAEAARIASWVDSLKKTGQALVVDTVVPLQRAAKAGKALYPENENGHPLRGGYAVIGDTLAAAVQSQIPDRPQGAVLVPIGHGREAVFLVSGSRRWLFDSDETCQANGWSLSTIRRVQPRDVTDLPFEGVIDTVRPGEYGPMRPGRTGGGH